MNKVKYFGDNLELKENPKLKGFGDTRIRIYEKTNGTYTLKSEGQNKINISGSAFIASKFINISPRIWTPTYNDALGLENNFPVISKTGGVVREEQVVLFCIGDTGCGPESRQVFNVKYTSWITPDKVIPFIVRTKEEGDIKAELREEYFGRKVTTNGNIEYYFKAFSTLPEIHQEFIDGTPIDENIYVNQRIDEVQTFIRYSMNVSMTDFRNYWDMYNIDDRRVSSISLLTGVKQSIEDDNGIRFDYYQNVRPLTVYHFPKEDMIGDKGLLIVYDQYM